MTLTSIAIELTQDEMSQLSYLTDYDPVVQRSPGILYALARRVGAALPATVRPAAGADAPAPG
jgi:hypothetical protein